MKFWNKIEQSLNQWIERLYQALLLILSKKTPGRVKRIAKKTQDEVQQTKQKTRNLTTVCYQRLIVPFFMFFKNFGYHISKTKQRIEQFITNIKKKKSEESKKSIRERLAVMISFLFLPMFVKVKDWLASLKPITLTLAISLSTLLGLTILSVYTAKEKLSEEQKRSVASANMDTQSIEGITSMSGEARPEYYKMDERFVKILNVEIPIYIESVNTFRSLKLDFVMIPSNRYIREYFYENEYLVQDRLNVMIEPVIPELPLEEEGRRIILEKIRHEMNELLDELRIKGKIEEVYIDSILGA